jgi:OOP family OmpA-OmpF porin
MSCKFLGLFGLLLSATLSAHAQGNTNIAATPIAAYGQDNQGSVARSQYGLCWRTGYWTPSDSLSGCDGELALPIANPIAPALVSNPAAITVNAAVSADSANCDFSVTLAESQTFGSGKTVLNKAAQQRIQAQIIEKLPACGKIDAIIVTGHADRLGSRKHNEEIAVKRAQTVAAFLKSKNVAAPIQIAGAGSNEPVAQCGENLAARKLAACLSPNRRVVIHVQGHEK